MAAITEMAIMAPVGTRLEEGFVGRLGGFMVIVVRLESGNYEDVRKGESMHADGVFWTPYSSDQASLDACVCRHRHPGHSRVDDH